MNFILPPDKKILILACSGKKHPIERGTPRQLYAGNLITWGFRYADKFGLHPIILSAKYGLINHDQVIDNYDQMFKKQYQGPWPDGTGFFLGGDLYFGAAPSRFQRLVPKSAIGIMTSRVKALALGDFPVPWLG